MAVTVLVRPGCQRVAARGIRALVRGVLRALRRTDAGVTILLTGNAEIRSLNRRYRGRNRATDVLSFPLEGPTLEGEWNLGDIAISMETAARQARAAGRSLDEEVRFLVLHGLLHLAGYDHERDNGEMNRVQARLARRFLGADVPSGGPRSSRRPAPAR